MNLLRSHKKLLHTLKKLDDPNAAFEAILLIQHQSFDYEISNPNCIPLLLEIIVYQFKKYSLLLV